MQEIRKIELEGQSIEYTLRKRKRQKNYSLAVHTEGRVVLTVPYWMSIRRAEKFIQDKKQWLLAMFQTNPQVLTVTARNKHYLTHRETARAFVGQRLAELNVAYGFEYNRISIRKNTSRWGSCSAGKNLNFDYRIIFLSPVLQDYLLVHELCHLKEMNHSPRFWGLVAQTLPNYKKLRSALRTQRL